MRLKRGIDPRVFRLMVLGALNSTQRWYSAKGMAPAQIADCFFAMLGGCMEDKA